MKISIIWMRETLQSGIYEKLVFVLPYSVDNNYQHCKAKQKPKIILGSHRKLLFKKFFKMPHLKFHVCKLEVRCWCWFSINLVNRRFHPETN